MTETSEAVCGGTVQMKAKQAAKKLEKYLKEKAVELGYDPEEIDLYESGDSWAFSDHVPAGCYAVCWGSGPYDWAFALCEGSSLIAGELGSYSDPGDFGDTFWDDCFFDPIVGFAMGVYRD